jgi:hypothetical protein
VAAADAAGTGAEPKFTVYGENLFTGNRWVMFAGLGLAEANETMRGCKRLESDYKVSYFLELETA